MILMKKVPARLHISERIPGLELEGESQEAGASIVRRWHQFRTKSGDWANINRSELNYQIKKVLLIIISRIQEVLRHLVKN